MLWVFKVFTFGGWPDFGLENYIETKRTYKVMSNDPNDRIVADIASIKSGVALFLIKNEFGLTSNFKTCITNHLLTD